MSDFEFKKGEVVYCVDDMYKKHPFTIGERRKRSSTFEVEGELVHSFYNSYSDKGFGWYPENALTK